MREDQFLAWLEEQIVITQDKASELSTVYQQKRSKYNNDRLRFGPARANEAEKFQAKYELDIVNTKLSTLTQTLTEYERDRSEGPDGGLQEEGGDSRNPRMTS